MCIFEDFLWFIYHAYCFTAIIIKAKNYHFLIFKKRLRLNELIYYFFDKNLQHQYPTHILVNL